MKNVLFTLKRQEFIVLFLVSGLFSFSFASEQTVTLKSGTGLSDALSALDVETNAITKLIIINNTDGTALSAGDFAILNGMTALEELDLSQDAITTTFTAAAFSSNSVLKKLTIPSTLTTFTGNANAVFSGSTALESIEAPEANTTFGSMEGMLLDKAKKGFVYFPLANKTEILTIDGNVVDSIPEGFFNRAVNLKRVIFGEGVRFVGWGAFRQATADITIPVEYIEMPSTMETISGQAFYELKSTIKQFICKATTPPKTGTLAFRESNRAGIMLGVPESALNAYKASTIVTEGAFPADQIVAYKEITMVNGTATQGFSVPGFSIQITADDPPANKSFVRWETTGGTFADAYATETFFTMPDVNVTITAVFEEAKPYTIIGATVSQGGVAAVGGSIELETAAEKIVGGQTLYFRKWQVNKGTGVVIANPNAVSTSFTMVDDEVEIEAVYGMQYMINITGGSAQLEAFEGEVITIVASSKPGYEFVNWSSSTPGVEFVDANSTNTTFVMPASDVVITANFNSTGINDVDAAYISLYPNPATDYIQLTGVKTGIYTIYNVLGSSVLQGEFTGNTIPVSGLSGGMYILKINNTSIQFIKK